MFGIPAGIISTREYGSADAFSNRDNYFVYDDIIYMTDFKENNFLNFFSGYKVIFLREKSQTAD